VFSSQGTEERQFYPDFACLQTKRLLGIVICIADNFRKQQRRDRHRSFF
jgi:hypothetical protein